MKKIRTINLIEVTKHWKQQLQVHNEASIYLQLSVGTEPYNLPSNEREKERERAKALCYQ